MDKKIDYERELMKKSTLKSKEAICMNRLFIHLLATQAKTGEKITLNDVEFEINKLQYEYELLNDNVEKETISDHSLLKESLGLVADLSESVSYLSKLLISDKCNEPDKNLIEDYAKLLDDLVVNMIIRKADHIISKEDIHVKCKAKFVWGCDVELVDRLIFKLNSRGIIFSPEKDFYTCITE